ncbi:glutamate-5-semialdehyde dehydrogenase [Paenibacillus sp. FSL W8-1187]|uniref:Gamma-glutamyl phosphate reductase n=1 Tax=Paenibacillus pasadenensis TaxID=217090 RepID=A0A2N5N5U2_9BACL|nr:glutamate-5-semialdehyde dehydrogenase [Paenibacillus pasadenensis]PLT45727.1 Gamma-glutamyl phosphate reductase [Paenibacillus pasadenensis]
MSMQASLSAAQEEARRKAAAARKAASRLAVLTTAQKDEALARMADALLERSAELIAANAIDLKTGEENGTAPSLLDRLKLTPERIEAIAEGVRQVIGLPDPVGRTVQAIERPNGLSIEQVTVPLGVIGMIYEARPNVTVDAAALSLKTGNAVVLRGGSAALQTNLKTAEILRSALAGSAIPPEALQLIEDPSRASADAMLKLSGLLDVIIPRGGAALIRNVVENATVPVIETGAGICHTYVHEDANADMAVSIAVNAKAQRPSVCNSMETLLLHRRFAERGLARIAEAMKEAGVELKGSPDALALLGSGAARPATDADYATEYNDYVLNIRIVDSLEEALEHIERFGTRHSECIVTESAAAAGEFLDRVDAAAVYHNASTRFTDGFEFGYGAEIGISTQKLHVRGPMGLPALTSTKYRIRGTGQVRG